MFFRAAPLALGFILGVSAQAAGNAGKVDTLEYRDHADRCQSLGCPTRIVGDPQLIYETVWGATTRRVLAAAPTAAIGGALPGIGGAALPAQGSMSMSFGFTLTPSSTEHIIPSHSAESYEIHVSEGFETLINGQLATPSSTSHSGSIVKVPAGNHFIIIRYTRVIEGSVQGSYRIVRSPTSGSKFGFQITHSDGASRPAFEIHIDAQSGQKSNLIVTTPMGVQTTLEVVINGQVVGHTAEDASQPGSEVAVVPLPSGPGYSIIIRPVNPTFAPGYVWTGDFQIVAQGSSNPNLKPPSAIEVVISTSFTVVETNPEYVITLPPRFDVDIAGNGYVLELHVSPGFDILVDGIVVGHSSDGQSGTFIRIPGGLPRIIIRYIRQISGTVTITGWYEIKRVPKPPSEASSRPAPEPSKPAPELPMPIVTPSNPPTTSSSAPTASAPACTPSTLKPWTKFSHWKAEWLKGPHEFDTNYDSDTEITVTDDENKTERFEVLVDGVSVGKTNDFTVERSAHCGSDADKCIEKGWGHGTFPIPAGQHKISIKLIGNDIDGGWWYFAGQYKITRKCGEPVQPSAAPVEPTCRPAEPVVTPSATTKPAPSATTAAPDCTASVLKPWTAVSRWKAEWLKGPHEFDTNYDYETEMTVTDDQNKTERFEIFVDGVSVGKTNDFTVERSAHCGTNADKCIERGWGHGTFPIPAGQHKIGIKLIGNDINGGWWYFAGQYKIVRSCKKAAAARDEL